MPQLLRALSRLGSSCLPPGFGLRLALHQYEKGLQCYISAKGYMNSALQPDSFCHGSLYQFARNKYLTFLVV